MTAPDDLAPLLGVGDVPDVGFRQGQIMAWNEANGTNTVSLGGVMLADLPVLNLGEFSLLQEGDIVGLLRFKTSYFILGRIIPPRTPDQNRATFAFGTDTAREEGFAIDQTVTNRGLCTIPAPSWADEALVLVAATAQAHNGRTDPDAALDYLGLKVQVNGVDAIPGAFFVADLGRLAAGSVVGSRLVTSVGGSVNGRAGLWANGGSWGTDDNNGVNVTTTAFFRRTD